MLGDAEYAHFVDEIHASPEHLRRDIWETVQLTGPDEFKRILARIWGNREDTEDLAGACYTALSEYERADRELTELKLSIAAQRSNQRELQAVFERSKQGRKVAKLVEATEKNEQTMFTDIYMSIEYMNRNFGMIRH